MLFAGQRIELADGLAEIEFNDGATVLLEGPATFEVKASDNVALVDGRLAAVVPQRARGFRVHTSSLDVFDVGTEFGLVAHVSGAAEVHVFNGLVKADVLDADGKAHAPSGAERRRGRADQSAVDDRRRVPRQRRHVRPQHHAHRRPA